MNDYNDESPRALGTQVSPDDLFYIEWARETKKKNIAVATDALQRLVTLNCALLGGNLALYGTTILPKWIQTVVIVTFFLSFLSSVYGMIPKITDADANDPTDIRASKERTLREKIWVLRLASFFLIVGFTLCVFIIAFGFVFMSTVP
jgi:hypothetical protein